MLVRDIFAADPARNIAPVVYFHEQSPAKVAEEVSEYFITGGYRSDDPRHQRVSSGIHEQFVKLLRGITTELGKPNGPELPASWISGFYGSGKSSFAKLLGLALDGLMLPNGQSLGVALLARDETPKAEEFQAAWAELRQRIDPLAVVFDIGAVARDGEHIHAAVKRAIQTRLRYCATSHYVADFELRLEIDGEWDAFLTCAEATLGRPWAEAKNSRQAEDQFSAVLHRLKPELYADPMAWIDSRAGLATGIGSSVAEATEDIAQMLHFREPGKTLFVVVDEVSQYIHQNDNRMLKLQSFVSDLGQKLKGQVWLLATGQQTLEDSDDQSNIGKLKDRFPPRLRVHLAPANIRDVVHRRLLRKQPTQEADLRARFQAHRADLKLHGYGCDSISEEDFVEVYPLLPGYVDLLMRITTNLRTQSSRAQGDDYAIRGLLQLLGELFRELALGDRPLGSLITMADIFEVQQTALDADVQNTLTRIFGHEALVGNEMALKVTKTVALLELIQDQDPTTAALVSKCLYAELGAGNQEAAVTEALETLRQLGLVSYSEKMGYKIQSSVGQEWARERDSHTVTPDDQSEIVAKMLKDLLGQLEQIQYRGGKFRWAAYFSDGRQRQDERLQVPSELAVVTVDFRYLIRASDRASAQWIQTSNQGEYRHRLVWVVGDTQTLEAKLREVGRSRRMIGLYQARASQLSREKQRQLFDEQTREEELSRQAKDLLAQAFVAGDLYFQGRQLDKDHYGSTFTPLLQRSGESIMADLYGRYDNIAVTTGMMTQLLEPTLTGLSNDLMGDGLGLFEVDGGKYVPTCGGAIPNRVAEHILQAQGISGGSLLTYFGGPPFGYAADMVKACLVGLLRAGRIRIRPDQGPEITSVRDPGARDMFLKDRDLKRADILPPADTGLSPRDRISICKFFKDLLSVTIDRENDAIADATFQQFPRIRERVRVIERRYNDLPHRPDLPPTLTKLITALEKCQRSRVVQDTVLAVFKHLDTLRDGLHLLNGLESDLTDAAVAAVARVQAVLNSQGAQLSQIEAIAPVKAELDALRRQLKLDRPWREIQTLEPALGAIETHYRTLRQQYLDQQDAADGAIRRTLRQRQGFSTLTTQQSDRIFKPLREAVYTTSVEALYPTLLELRDTAILKLQRAEAEANRLLDDVLSQSDAGEVITVPHQLSGKEISSPEQVEEVVQQLRQRLLAQLQDKHNVRIRLI